MPIIKWKKGEQEALKNLTDEQKSKIVPLIEITDYENPSIILECLNICFPYPVFIDTIIAAEDDRDFLFSIIQEIRKTKQRVCPVLYFDDIQKFSQSLIEVTKHIGIRIPIPEDIDSPNYDIIFKTIKKFKQNNKKMLIDIILDVNVITENIDANRQLRETKDVIKRFLLHASFYNAIIISSTSFPESISSVPAGGQTSYSRYDFKLFKNIYEDSLFQKIKNALIYSDYGVTKFTDTEIDFSKIRYILPKVKYTTFDKYLVLKGQKDKETRETVIGYIELANIILSSDDYCGEDFSFGDLEIKERALGLNKKGPGNNGNWVTIAANHHIAVVVEQLSKFFEI